MDFIDRLKNKVEKDAREIISRRLINRISCSTIEVVEELEQKLGQRFEGLDRALIGPIIWEFDYDVKQDLRSFKKMWGGLKKKFGVDKDYGLKMVCQGICSLSCDEANIRKIENHIRAKMDGGRSGELMK